MIKKFYWQNQKDLDFLKKEINDSCVVISSTDTIYGFLGNITRESFNSICKLKGIFENLQKVVSLAKFVEIK